MGLIILMAEPSVKQLCDDARFFGELRQDAIDRGYLLAAFTYGLSAVRLYAEALTLRQAEVAAGIAPNPS